MYVRKCTKIEFISKGNASDTASAFRKINFFHFSHLRFKLIGSLVFTITTVFFFASTILSHDFFPFLSLQTDSQIIINIILSFVYSNFECIVTYYLFNYYVSTQTFPSQIRNLNRANMPNG